MKRKLFYFLLFIMIFSLSSSAFSAQKNSDFDRADKLVAEGKIPMYVRNKGQFVYSYVRGAAHFQRMPHKAVTCYIGSAFNSKLY